MSDDTRDQIARARAKAAAQDEAKRAKLVGDSTQVRTVACIDCAAPTPVTAFGWEMARIASEMLLRAGEQALGNDEITRCPECHRAHQEGIAMDCSRRHWRIQELLERLKGNAVDGKFTSDVPEANVPGELRRMGLERLVERLVEAQQKAREQRRTRSKTAPPPPEGQQRMGGIE